MAKGSRARPYSVPFKEFDATFDTIFGKKEPKPRWVPPALPGEDMQVRVKENVDDIGKCGCGRSPTGKCIGWHELSESEFQSKLQNYLAEEADKVSK